MKLDRGLSRLLLALMPIAFFGALLLSRTSLPRELVFDELHYIPAAKSLATFSDNLNWVHPPFAKYLMGLGWYLFTDTLHLVGEPTIFRCMAVVFGLWSLWAVRAWMLALGFSPAAAVAAVWLTGFNFLWFVQSKTGMLDIFYVAFALWGVLDVWHHARGWRHWRGWVFLGLSLSCKWAAAPYILIALVMARRGWQSRDLLDRFMGGALAGVVYTVTFIPLVFLKNGAVPVTDFITYHQRMLSGFDSIASADHSYISHWWQWPTLARPMWYAFESGAAGDHCIWLGGNPVLFWAAFPLLIAVLWYAFKLRDQRARLLSVLYWVPLLFWAVAPRKLQMFYYYLAPSFMLGPIVVWAHELLANRAPEVRATRGWLLWGFVLLCAAAFVYFLPIMDGRLLPPGRYQSYMWFRSWI